MFYFGVLRRKCFDVFFMFFFINFNKRLELSSGIYRRRLAVQKDCAVLRKRALAVTSNVRRLYFEPKGLFFSYMYLL